MSPQPRPEHPYHRSGARRGSNASSIHSVGGQLDSGHGSSPLFELGQNAISTLLQPPIVRTGLLPHSSAPASTVHKPPTAKDIPPVTLTNVAKIDSSDFAPYLTQVGALHEQLRRIRESDDDGSAQIFRRNSRNDELVPDDGHLRPRGRQLGSRKSSITSLKSVTSTDAPQMRRRSSSGLKGSKAIHGPPPLSTIPNVYFDQEFHLENPRTFDVVSERSEVVQQTPGSTAQANATPTAPRKALATNAILQEKLSWYMDTVEMHLITSISTASTTFFTALGSLRELHSEAADSVERIQTLRKELDALDKHIATSGLDIVQKKRRRENLQQLNDAVKQLQEIIDFVAVCEGHVEAGELEDALDSIDTLEMLISGRRRSAAELDSTIQLRDLRGAVALRGISEDMMTLKTRIGKAYETKFVAILLEDARKHVETVSSQEVLLRWSGAAMRARGRHSREPSAFPAYLAGIDGIRKELKPVIAGLQRSGYITPAIAAYRELILKEIRNLVRKPLPSSNDDDNESMMSVSTVGSRRMTQQEKSSILARNLRALEPEDAEDLFVTIYVSVTETLRRLSTQVKVLFDVAGSIGEEPELQSGLRSPSIKSPPLNSANRDLQEDIHLAMDMANLTGQAVDLGQEKILKVLRVRSEQTTHLPLIWFLRYFTLNFYFATECESISGRSGTPLKTTVNTHIKDFIQHHGDREKQKLAQAMESDQWSAKDFTEKNNELLTRVLESSTKDAAEWSEASKIWVPLSEEDSETPAKVESESNGTSKEKEKEKTRSAMIDEEPFILPNSAILCLQGMSHFLQLIATMPSMASEVSVSLIGYLQLFNSRCTQLILGAGATRSAGLKNITTRHLALAAQALAFISALIPHVREFVRRHAGSGPNANNPGAPSVMGEFDKVRRLFQEHQNSIYDKLVEIMSGRAATHAKTMKNVDWDSTTAVGVNGYMETLVKDTVTLYKVLSKHLPKGTILMIMPPVFDSYKSHLSKTLESLKPNTEHGVRRMENDLKFLNEKLGKIEGYGDVGDRLLSIAQAKRADIEAAQSAAEARKAAEAIRAREAAEAAEAAKAREVAAAANGTGENGVTAQEEGSQEKNKDGDSPGALNGKPENTSDS
ncbi:Vps54-like protein-domain-containing protein [Microdochium trichocladiopsis]|uniref:Vacuolar protein sorting-associated protein 54 n=1 Tax=Microdochium trichocladiopsis TaxID=1682393 RepID=A0A9P9BS55_9PEZI|nr:Vps54-like protein-domain-containing protein [Microdochium trichocladiopsis]KAH7033403.1 Vps54-like protein-domain-containing protein [Microdochium trichocladiopsis]